MAKSYVIMLDEDISDRPDQWVIRTEDETLAQARLRREYVDTLYTMPRDVCDATRVEDKSLEDTRTGKEHDGAIYEFIEH